MSHVIRVPSFALTIVLYAFRPSLRALLRGWGLEERTVRPADTNMMAPVLCALLLLLLAVKAADEDDKDTRSTPPFVEAEGCPVLDAGGLADSEEAVAALARSLHAGGRPVLLRGLVPGNLLARGASKNPRHGASKYPRHDGGEANWRMRPVQNPPHALCSARWTGARPDAVPAADLSAAFRRRGVRGAAFVEACAWARTRLYGASALWRALWRHDARRYDAARYDGDWDEDGGPGGPSAAPPPGQAVLSRNRAIEFHSHGPTLNALLGGSRRWFLFDLGSGRRPNQEQHRDRFLGMLPLLRRLARNATRAPRSEDWLPRALPARFGGPARARAAFECAQAPGEVLFVPRGVHHAIVERPGTESSSALFFIEQSTVWEQLDNEGKPVEEEEEEEEDLSSHSEKQCRLTKSGQRFCKRGPPRDRP